jgi:prepilin-type N-terminal cleavage/methylation domain-containing protein
MLCRKRDAAFTLIELLVVLAIIALLVSILAIGLKSIRERARRAASMANLRTHVQVFGTYTNEHRSVFPYFTKPGLSETYLIGGGIETHKLPYFAAHKTWHIALADGYYTGDARSKLFLPPGYQNTTSFWPYEIPYLYGCAFIAHPEYWSPYSRIGPEQYQPTRTDWVTYPSEKALIVESWPFVERVQADEDQTEHFLYAGMCDGSARKLSAYERMHGYWRGDGLQFIMDGAVHMTDWPPLLHTLDGVRGRDVR